MVMITMPADPVPAKIDWSIDQPAQANRGEFTGRRRVTLLAAAPRLYAAVTLPAIRGEPNIYAWRAFVFDCDGIANRYRLVACERDQIAGLDVRVAGAGQFGRTLKTRGWGAAGVKLRRGQFVTVGEQLLTLMADVVAAADGTATITFKPFIRVVPGDNEAIEVRRPFAVMSMSDPRNGWAVDIGQEYAVTFQCEEAF